MSAKLAAAAAVSFAEYNLILRADPMKCNPGRRNLAFRGAWDPLSKVCFLRQNDQFYTFTFAYKLINFSLLF